MNALVSWLFHEGQAYVFGDWFCSKYLADALLCTFTYLAPFGRIDCEKKLERSTWIQDYHFWLLLVWSMVTYIFASSDFHFCFWWYIPWFSCTGGGSVCVRPSLACWSLDCAGEVTIFFLNRWWTSNWTVVVVTCNRISHELLPFLCAALLINCGYGSIVALLLN